MKNLYKSLAKFQKEVKNIPKNSKGYGYDYAKLEDIIRIVTPTLNKNGLVLIQSIDTDEHSRLPSVKNTKLVIESSTFLTAPGSLVSPSIEVSVEVPGGFPSNYAKMEIDVKKDVDEPYTAIISGLFP